MATFKQAFAKARDAGKKTFTWNGKRYTTEMADSKSSAPKTSRRPSNRAPGIAGRTAATKARGSADKAKKVAADANKMEQEIKAANATAARRRNMTPKAKKAEAYGEATRMYQAKMDEEKYLKSKRPKARPASAAATNKTKTQMSFKEAFAAADKAGKKTFTWNGKRYTTKKK